MIEFVGFGSEDLFMPELYRESPGAKSSRQNSVSKSRNRPSLISHLVFG